MEKDTDSMELEQESNPLEQEDEEKLEEENSKLNGPLKEFILTLETLKLLYDPKNINYTNKYKRHKALGILLPILRKIKPHSTIDDVKKKINSLRSNYRRFLRNAKKTGQDMTKSKIWYYPYLEFFKKLDERTDEEKEPSSKTGVVLRRRLPTVESSFSLVRPVSSSRLRSRASNRIIQSQAIDSPGQSLRNKNLRANPWRLRYISSYIVQEWAEILEKLDPMQRLYAKKAINDVLFEAELGNLHKNSVQINEPDFNVASSTFY